MQTRNMQQDATQPPASGSATAAVSRRLEGSESREAREMSVIGADIVITGNIEASVDLHIEGRVVGDVRCATLILGDNSAVNGRIYAARVKVSGSVDGAIETKDLAVEGSARVTGDITYERLRVANGAVVEGKMTRKAPVEVPEEANKLKLVVEAPKSEKTENVA